MLLRLVVKNFLSFYHETEFDMFPNTRKERFLNHIYQSRVPLLKQAAIYGANGSGKSNFIRAIRFLRSFITEKDFIKHIDLDEYRFQLIENNKMPVSFEIEFLYDEKYYIYEVDISDKVIEKLWVSGIGHEENKLIFERNGTDVRSDDLQNETSSKQLLQLNQLSSLLPLNKEFPVLTNQDVNCVSDWFDQRLDIITIDSTIPALIWLMSNNADLLHFTNSVFHQIGIGINSVDIDDTPLDKWLSVAGNPEKLEKILSKQHLTPESAITRLENKRNVFDISLKKGMEIVQEFAFEQTGISGYKKQLKISSQSDGTVRLLTLIPAIYNAMKKQKVVFIDEIDNSIHPNLVYALLRFFSDSNSNGQLIFTTHTTHLLDQQKLMRLDEVWITDKIEGNTRMRSLNDFKIHNTINIENGYLDGRYGGVPVIQDIEENE